MCGVPAWHFEDLLQVVLDLRNRQIAHRHQFCDNISDFILFNFFYVLGLQVVPLYDGALDPFPGFLKLVFYWRFFFNWLFKKLAHCKEVVDKAGGFTGLLLDELRDFCVGVKVLRPFLLDKFVGQGFGPLLLLELWLIGFFWLLLVRWGFIGLSGLFELEFLHLFARMEVVFYRRGHVLVMAIDLLLLLIVVDFFFKPDDQMLKFCDFLHIFSDQVVLIDRKMLVACKRDINIVDRGTVIKRRKRVKATLVILALGLVVMKFLLALFER